MKYIFSSIILFLGFALAAQNQETPFAKNTPTETFQGLISEAQIVYVSGDGVTSTIGTAGYTQLTLESVLDNITFPKESGIYKSLKGLVHCWYAIALEENCSEEEAAMVALIKLGDQLDEMAGWGNK